MKWINSSPCLSIWLHQGFADALDNVLFYLDARAEDNKEQHEEADYSKIIICTATVSLKEQISDFISVANHQLPLL